MPAQAPQLQGIKTVDYGWHNTRTLALATAYQATDPTKASIWTLTFSCPSSLAGAVTAVSLTNSGEVRAGMTNAVATGTGIVVATYQKSLTITLLGITIGTNDYETKTILVPAGGYLAVRQLTGSGITLITATDQSIVWS